MNFRPFYIKKLSISNFLSFFGNNEINLEPFTAILCNYFEGKEDAIRAIEFVLGADLNDIHIGLPQNLVHKALQMQYYEGKEIKCFVEVTLKMIGDITTTAFYRGLKDDNLEHKINGTLVSCLQYQENLKRMNINFKYKNIVFRKCLFNDVIWGKSDDLEALIIKILRENSYLHECKKLKNKVRELVESKKAIFVKTVQKLKKSHETVEKFLQHYNSLITKRECSESNDEGSYSEEPLRASDLEAIGGSTIYNLSRIQELEERQEKLREEYIALDMNASKHLSELYFYEVKVFSKMVNSTKLKDRISDLKIKLKVYENILPTIWREIQQTDQYLHDLELELSIKLATIEDRRRSYFLQNRITMYGRLIDYLKPTSYLNILIKVLGESLVYGNFCDSVESAVSHCKELKRLMYEGRENFIIFEHYSPKLKDYFLMSGGSGIKINNVQELQIFLCKLKQYGLITQVPIIFKQKFVFQLEEGRDFPNDMIFLSDNVYLTSDGIISYTFEDNATVESEAVLTERINELLVQQEVKYNERRDKIFTKLENKRNMNILENDIMFFNWALKKYGSSNTKERQKQPFSKVYDYDFNIFQEHEHEMKEKECEEECMYDSDETSNLDKPAILKTKEISAILEGLSKEKENIKLEMKENEKNLTILKASLNRFYFRRVRIFFSRPRRYSFCLEAELMNLEKLMSNEEMDDFKSLKNWRKETIKSLIRDVNKKNSEIKLLIKDLRTKTELRQNIITPLLVHCNTHLHPRTNEIMEAMLSSLNLKMNELDGVQLVSSLPEGKTNYIDIKNFNTFVKFTATLSLFLQIAIYDKTPVIVLDNLQEFLPTNKDIFKAVMNESKLEKICSSNENIGFQVLLRLGDYLKSFTEKDTASQNISHGEKERKSTGLIQIIFFTSEDLAHAAHHQIWIKSAMLPDELITQNCDSYSVIHEITFE